MSRSSESHGTYQTVDEYNAAALAARLAKAERERADIATEIVILRGQFKAQQQHDGALIASLSAKVEDLTRALEEAEKVIAPLAEYAAKYDTPEYDQFDWAAIAVGHLRVARKWMESNHD